MADEVVYNYEMLADIFNVANCCGAFMVFPLVHREYNEESFAARRQIVEFYFKQHEVGFDEILCEYCIMNPKQYPIEHETIIAHVATRGSDIDNTKLQKTAIGIAKAISGIHVILNIPSKDGLVLISNNNGLMKFEKRQSRFHADDIIRIIEKEYETRERQSRNIMILIWLGVVDSDESDVENI